MDVVKIRRMYFRKTVRVDTKQDIFALFRSIPFYAAT